MFHRASYPQGCHSRESVGCHSGVGRNLLRAVVIAIAFVVLTPTVSTAGEVVNKCDSLNISTLNMSDAEIAEICGLDSATLAKGPTLQQLNEEDPSYIKREYDHKQQVVVGGVIMLCVALAMVLMNNYNPKR
ncbi:MAG: hypothetical protein MJY85_10365 [Fibrobacter sp.]|nr:hypothetical protein [Fibrobacter sp.]